MMTCFEALDRAKVIWGDQVKTVHPHWIPGEWTVETKNSMWHSLDGNMTC